MTTPYDSERRPGTTGPSPTDDLRHQAHAATDMAKEQADHYSDVAANKVDDLARSAESAADALRQQDDPAGLSAYVAQIAGNLGQFADSLRDKSAEELLHEANRLAREHPALFITGSVALGLGLSRFLGASSTRAQSSQVRAGQVRASEPGTETASADPIGAAAVRPSGGVTRDETEAVQADLPTFNPASQAVRDEVTADSRVPYPDYPDNDKGSRGGLHS